MSASQALVFGGVGALLGGAAVLAVATAWFMRRACTIDEQMRCLKMAVLAVAMATAALVLISLSQ